MKTKQFIVSVLILYISKPLYGNDLLDTVQVLGGVYGSIYIHELGHASTMKLYGGKNINIEVPRKGSVFSGSTTALMKKGLEPREKQLIAISGLLAANIAGEVVLQSEGLHSNHVARGVVSTAQVSNLIHVVSYYMDKKNDISSYENSGGNAHLFSALLVGYTVYSLDRMKKNEIPLFGIDLRF